EIFYRHSPADEADIAPGLFRRHAEAYATPRTRHVRHSVAEAYLAPGASFGVDDEPRRVHIVACQIEHGAYLGRCPCRYAGGSVFPVSHPDYYVPTASSDYDILLVGRDVGSRSRSDTAG